MKPSKFKNTCRLFTLRMLKTKKPYLNSSQQDLKQRHILLSSQKQPALEACYSVVLWTVKEKRCILSQKSGETLSHGNGWADLWKRFKTKNSTDPNIKRYHSWSNKGNVTRYPNTSGGENKGKSRKKQLQLDELMSQTVLIFFLFLLVMSIRMESKDSSFVNLCRKRRRQHDIMTMVKKFFDCNNLLWDLVKAICDDGAPAMLEKNSRFMALVKKMNPNLISSHCILWHALALKTLLSYLQDVLDVVVQAVNLIWAWALNQHMEGIIPTATVADV